MVFLIIRIIRIDITSYDVMAGLFVKPEHIGFMHPSEGICSGTAVPHPSRFLVPAASRCTGPNIRASAGAMEILKGRCWNGYYDILMNMNYELMIHEEIV